MSAIAGTITGVSQVLKGNSGYGGTSVPSRETWLLTLSFPAYTGSSDTATVAGVIAAINSHCRDGKTRTFISALPAGAGYDAASPGQAVYLCGTGTNQAILTVSADAAAGQLSDKGATELTATTGVTNGVQWLVTCDVNYL